MPDHDAVADALARLANGDTPPVVQEGRPAREADPPAGIAPASIVAEADDAFGRLSRAAAFVDDGGERRLSRAVTRAARSGDDAVAERGRELLTEIDRFRGAAADETGAPDP